VNGSRLSHDELATELEHARERIADLEHERWRSDERLIGRLGAHFRDGLVVLSPAGVILDVNAAFCDMTGFGHEELVGHGLPQPYCPAEEHDANLRAFHRLLDQDVISLEVTFMRRSGERFPVTIIPTVLRDAEDAPICLVATVRNMTESERAERQLRESEARYRSLVDGMFDGLAYCRMYYDDSGQAVDWEYLAVNPAFHRLTGLGDVVGGRISEVLPTTARDTPELLQAYGRVAATGQPEEFEIDFRPLGRIYHVAAFCPVHEHFVAVFEDVTERRRAEWEADRTLEFLGLMNESRTLETVVRRAVTFFQRHSGCDAVGVRLQEGPDYPYFETHGFTADFIRSENSLCARDKGGAVLRDDRGDPVLDCMCGNVIRRRFDPTQPFFTPRGSFWSNGTSRTLAESTDEDRLTHTRNRCNGDGYESVLLIALRAGDEPLGLLQMNALREDAYSSSTVALWERLAGYLAVGLAKVRAEEQQRELIGKLEQSLLATIAALGTTVELRDPYTAGHQRRVTILAEAIAQRLGWADERLAALRIAAQVHDIGKLAIPAEILSKPARLSGNEFSLIQTHSQIGFDILGTVDFGLPVAEIVYQHHERLDGSGYPRGLSEAEIMPEASLLAVADVAEAMVSHRPYRPALPLDAAMAELEGGAGSRYDAAACSAAIALFREQGFTFAE
jgi:PAS domain S-box-containing protein